MHRVALLIVLAASVPAQAQTEGGIDFAHEVLPLLRERCAACHTNGKAEGGLSMDTRETLLQADVIVPGKAAESYLIDRVIDPAAEFRMPPKGPALSEEQVATLRRWIDQGVPWEPGFSFAEAGSGLPLEPRRPELPPPTDGRTHPLDRIIDAYFRTQNVTPPPPLDDAAFCRRVYLDLVGLLPTPEQLAAFLDDSQPDKRERLVQNLLGDDQAYAEHWLTFWNDLLRNDYAGTGYIDGGRGPIHTWLYRALRENMPFDQFVRELIDPTAESEGFIKGIKWRGAVNASQVPEIQFAQNVSQVFLGINMKCASCHDSFIDSWKLEDAYGLAAIVAEDSLEMFRCDKPTGRRAEARFLFPELGKVDPSLPRAERLRQTAALMTSPENGLLTRTIVNRLWQRLMGRGVVEPVDVMANRPWSPDLLDYLAADLADNGYDLKRTLRLIVTSRTYQSQSVPPSGEAEVASQDYVFRGPIPRRLTAEQFVDALWRITDTAPEKPAVDLGRDPEPVRASLVASDALMRSLGRPNREQVVSTRPADLSTLQALDLTNGQALAGLLAQGARNLLARHPGASPEDLTDRIFRAALARRPTAAEQAMAGEILGTPISEEGLVDLLWIVFMLPEFQLIQ